MTRWARSGNTQKHKKMPGDATQWKEFVQTKMNNKQRKQEAKKQNSYCKDNSLSSSAADCDERKQSMSTSNDFDLAGSFPKKETHLSDSTCSKSKKFLNDSVQNCYNKSEKCAQNDDKFEKNSKNNSSDKKELQRQEQTFSPGKKKHQEKDKKIKNEGDKSSSDKLFEKKKKTYMDKLSEKRAKMGIPLLPAKSERKLYNIRRRLKQKGVPPPALKEILRKERRKEELKFRKTFNPSKLCFNCRQPGHILADCPVKLGSSNQETGICFKCGSSEHTSYKCLNKVQGFPFAKCFICKEQGHISRDCPSNKHGVYPEGGKCNVCGNVNHLKKDCPSLKKAEQVKSEFTLHTISEVSSVDAEVIEKLKIKQKKKKQSKVVKFLY